MKIEVVEKDRLRLISLTRDEACVLIMSLAKHLRAEEYILTDPGHAMFQNQDGSGLRTVIGVNIIE